MIIPLLSASQVKRLLEAMGTIRDVAVTYRDLSSDAAPACGRSSENVMSVEFRQDFGPLPAARVDGSQITLGGVASGGGWRGGGGGGASLAMLTEYVLTCSAGADSGAVYFLYDGAHSQVHLLPRAVLRDR
jgi:hypothetical protein